jgi:hypothetical protein
MNAKRNISLATKMQGCFFHISLFFQAFLRHEKKGWKKRETPRGAGCYYNISSAEKRN